ncbi:MAG: hypothetical protein ACK5OW_00215 [bacterium]|jgi:hypothetical protein
MINNRKFKTNLLITIFNFLFGISLFGQNSYVVLKYSNIKIVTPTDTTIHKIQNYFYFNECSFVISSQSTRVYDILIPSVNEFDVTGVRVLQDTGVKLEDGGVIYEAPMHKRQVAVYFSEGLTELKIMRKDKTGVIFY